ncbi:MAG: CBS domain-containing protein, partial [Thermoleophilaceae bacterium]
MSAEPVTVTRADSVRSVARSMGDRAAAAAIVESEPPGGDTGIFTVRDLVQAVAEGAELEDSRVGDQATPEAITATTEWTLSQAATAMVAGRCRHLLVPLEGRPGIVSIRDIVRGWSKEQASRSATMQIREAMKRDFATVDPDSTVRDGARLMTENTVGA